MKKKATIKYFKREWQAMEMYLNSYSKTLHQEDLHQFRVQVKKIKALLILVGRYRLKHKVAFKPVKKVFKQAGKLRNAFISRKLTSQPILMDKAARNFQLCAHDSLTRIRKARRKLKKRLGPIPQKHIRQFYKSQFRRIAAGLAAARELHDCRKRIKVLLYNYPLVRYDLRICLDTAYLNVLQERLGNWHDKWLAGTVSEKDKGDIAFLTQDFYWRASGCAII